MSMTTPSRFYRHGFPGHHPPRDTSDCPCTAVMCCAVLHPPRFTCQPPPPPLTKLDCPDWDWTLCCPDPNFFKACRAAAAPMLWALMLEALPWLE